MSILSMLKATSNPKAFEAANQKNSSNLQREYFHLRTEKQPGWNPTGLESVQNLFEENRPVSSSVSSNIDPNHSSIVLPTLDNDSKSLVGSFCKPTHLRVDVNLPVDDQSWSKNRVEKCLSNKYAIPTLVATAVIAYLVRIYLHFQTK